MDFDKLIENMENPITIKSANPHVSADKSFVATKHCKTEPDIETSVQVKIHDFDIKQEKLTETNATENEQIFNESDFNYTVQKKVDDLPTKSGILSNEAISESEIIEETENKFGHKRQKRIMHSSVLESIIEAVMLFTYPAPCKYCSSKQFFDKTAPSK